MMRQVFYVTGHGYRMMAYPRESRALAVLSHSLQRLTAMPGELCIVDEILRLGSFTTQ